MIAGPIVELEPDMNERTPRMNSKHETRSDPCRRESPPSLQHAHQRSSRENPGSDRFSAAVMAARATGTECVGVARVGLVLESQQSDVPLARPAVGEVDSAARPDRDLDQLVSQVSLPSSYRA